MIAANWIFQFSIITMVCTLLTAPYLSSIFAYEDMGIYAKLTILDSILKLSTVCLLYFTPGDKLIISGLLALCVSILTNSFYIVYCLKHFPVCRVRPRWIKDIFKQLASFNAWNLLGQISWMAKNQGLAFILNIFYGPIVNAAQSIANNIRGLASTLGSGFGNAIKPQIMKGYVVGSREDFFTLVYRGSKMTFFLVGVITIPLLFVLSDILHIWLGEISTYMVTFTQLVLIETTFEQMSQAIGNANQATGKIASYQVLIGLAGLLNLPISYIALKWGGVPETAFVISVLLQMVIVGIRFYYLDRIQKGRFKDAITRVLFPCLFCGILAFSLCSLLEIILLTGKFFIIRGAIYFIITTTIFFFIGLTSKERIKITQFAKKKLQAI
jgi:O-antigen/teichoic acid export membrane protein